jgi:hypothetical protein
LWGLRKKDNTKQNGQELDDMLNQIPGAASNSSKAVSNSAAVDEEMILRLSDS